MLLQQGYRMNIQISTGSQPFSDIIFIWNKFKRVNINPFQDMRAVILLFYNKRLSESRASEQNKKKPMGAGWTAYSVLLLLLHYLQPEDDPARTRAAVKKPAEGALCCPSPCSARRSRSRRRRAWRSVKLNKVYSRFTHWCVGRMRARATCACERAPCAPAQFRVHSCACA
jgi:hypothetical protein